MKTNIIRIDNQGNGFSRALDETEKAAVFEGLDQKDAMRLSLLTQEMLSLAQCITGDMQADFWIEGTNGNFDLHMTTETVMDKEKRFQLIESSTSHRNEAATGFLGKLRDALEEAMTAEADRQTVDLPMDVIDDLPVNSAEMAEWDGLERSILQSAADQVKIGIRGGVVDVTICKRFG